MKLFVLIVAICLVFFERLLIVEPHTPIDLHLTGFYALFGFVVCFLLMIGAKFLGKVWLQRRRDYYDAD